MVKSAMLFLDQSKYAQVPNLEIIPTRSEILAGLIENKEEFPAARYCYFIKCRETQLSESTCKQCELTLKLFHDAANICINWNSRAHHWQIIQHWKLQFVEKCHWRKVRLVKTDLATCKWAHFRETQRNTGNGNWAPHTPPPELTLL